MQRYIYLNPYLSNQPLIWLSYCVSHLCRKPWWYNIITYVIHECLCNCVNLAVGKKVMCLNCLNIPWFCFWHQWSTCENNQIQWLVWAYVNLTIKSTSSVFFLPKQVMNLDSCVRECVYACMCLNMRIQRERERDDVCHPAKPTDVFPPIKRN